jgi:DNA-binding transcriptional regulator YiaG
MTPAELKTMRESLGLSINWLAERAGVSPRSAQYWESGERSVPSDVEELLIDIDLMMEKIVGETL